MLGSVRRMRQRYLRVRNFEQFQHYKERNPIWIKLYCSLLDDYEFAQLPDQTKFHAVGLMLLASRLNNKFPEDERWLRAKINAETEINLEKLLEIGFLEVTETEKSNKKQTAKNQVNARNSNKTQGESASTEIFDGEISDSAEERREEESSTHTQQKRGATAPEEIADEKAEEKSVCVNSRNFPENSNGHRSQFSLDECLEYVKICETKGEPVKNAKGLASHLYKTGEADAFILGALHPEKAREKDIEIYGEPRKFTDEPCLVCYGSKMEVVEGRGARPCPHCKNERGQSTGKQPEGVKKK
jgi:hypothetical protein